MTFRRRVAITKLKNRFHVAVRLFSNRWQMTSKCVKNKKVTHEAQPSLSLVFLPHFDVLCHLLLNRHTATWNLFVLYNKELKYTEKKPFFYFKFRHFDRHENSTLTYLLSIKNEANWLVAMLSKELWLVQWITQLSNLNRGLSSYMCLSFNRSQLRTNQNARRTELIILGYLRARNAAAHSVDSDIF